MSYPGISADPEALERWLDATIDLRQTCKSVHQRWNPVGATTPSGKALYECKNCGRLSAGAEAVCWPLVGDKGKWR